MPLHVKNIIFDLGDVILPLDTARMFRAMEALGILDAKARMSEGETSKIFRRFETGHASADDITNHMRSLAPHAPDDASLHAAFNIMLLDFPAERIDLLRRLKGSYRLFLFSNTNALHHAHFQDKHHRQFGHSLDDHFEKAYYSHLIGKRKPDVEAFRHVIADACLTAAETMFIDDVAENIHGAKEAGLHGVHLAPGMTILDLDL